MQSVYHILADVVLYIHFGYVLFVIFGLLAILAGYLFKWEWVRNRWFRGIHLAMILVVVLESWWGVTCPLTTWENELRRMAGQPGQRESLIADVVHELMFFQAEPWVFTLSYTLFGAAVAATLFLVPPRWRKKRRKAERAGFEPAEQGRPHSPD